jgi:uncharacterized membrane protein
MPAPRLPQAPSPGMRSAYDARMPSDLHELTRHNVESIAQLEANGAKAGPHPIADEVTRILGSMPSVVVHVVGFVLWLSANTLLPRAWHFDPFPFPLLAILVPLEALVVALFILMSENRQRLLDDRRASLNLQISLLAEQENTRMLRLLSAVAQAVGIDASAVDQVTALEENVQPEKVLAQIDDSKTANGQTRSKGDD